jgi:glycosyltransferase involved in cell wall biosynthesis
MLLMQPAVEMESSVNNATAATRVIIIIPAMNEASSVGQVVRGALRVLPAAVALVVDDGSTDRTTAEGEAAGALVVRLPYNLGIGGAVQTGFRYALEKGFDVAVQVDGDGQHLPEEIPKLLRTMESENADLVVGSRFIEESGYRPSFARRIGIRLFAALLGCICGRRLTDTTSGFRAAGRLAIAHLSEMYACDYPEVESLVTLHRAGFKIVEVPVHMVARAEGSSSIGAIQGFYYMLKVVLAVLVDVVAKPIFTRQEIETTLRAARK